LPGCDNLYFVCHYTRAQGGELFKLIAQEPLSEEQAREVTFQILDAVSHLHDHGIVHLDLKVSILYTNTISFLYETHTNALLNVDVLVNIILRICLLKSIHLSE